MAQQNLPIGGPEANKFDAFAQQWFEGNTYPFERTERFDEICIAAMSAFPIRMNKKTFFGLAHKKELSWEEFNAIMQIMNLPTKQQMGLDTFAEYEAMHGDIDIWAEQFLSARQDKLEELRKEFDEIEAQIDNTAVIGQA